MIHGHGIRFEPNVGCQNAAACQLQAGWSVLEIDVHFVNQGYGFELAFGQPHSNTPFPLYCSPSQIEGESNGWQWRTDESNEWRPLATLVDGQRPWLSPSHLATWETRQTLALPESADSLFRLGSSEDERDLYLNAPKDTTTDRSGQRSSDTANC